MEMRINKSGKPKLTVKGPTLVNPNRKVNLALTLGGAKVPVRVRLQVSKDDWKPPTRPKAA